MLPFEVESWSHSVYSGLKSAKETCQQLCSICFNNPSIQWYGAQWHFGNSPQLLTLNQALPIWKSIRREMWPDCLDCSFPALTSLSSVTSVVTPTDCNGGLWYHLVVEMDNSVGLCSFIFKWIRERQKVILIADGIGGTWLFFVATYPSESMLFSWTMAFRASEFA